jgi:hypothetical protein
MMRTKFYQHNREDRKKERKREKGSFFQSIFFKELNKKAIVK